MKPERVARLRYLTALWFVGGTALAALTWTCTRLGLNGATTAFVFLIVIVLLSQLDGFISSVVFSAIAAGCVKYFFLAQIFSFRVDSPLDIAMLTGFIAASLIVTGLVGRMRRLGAAERGQARLLALIKDPIIARDLDDRITYWNQGAEAFYGWSAVEASGKLIYQLLQTTSTDPRDEIKATVMQTGHWEGEVGHTKRDGTQVTMASRWSPQRDDSGRIVGFIMIYNDITERKRTEAALRRVQETYLAEAQQLSHTGSFGWNASTGEQTWSQETFRIFQYEPTTVPSIELVTQRVPPEDVGFFRKMVDKAVSNRRDFDWEHRLLMPDGTIKHLRVVARCITGGSDGPQFMGTVMDVSAAKKAEEERIRAQEALQQVRAEFAHAARVSMLGELAASIAHEVIQPLTAISTAGETALLWLQRPVPNVAEAGQSMQRVVHNARRAADIIGRIRAMAAGRAPQKTALSLDEVIKESMIFVRHDLGSKSVSASLDLAPRPSRIIGDRTQLQQVVVNLTINAAQAMAEAGTVRRELLIRTSQPNPQMVYCTIEDSGPGIKPEHLDHLFDSFFTTKDSGMGMGLRISQSIIEAHGGCIRVDNKSVLGGARFSFGLPIGTAKSTGL
jgi:PAS domain S-box-containing protein